MPKVDRGLLEMALLDYQTERSRIEDEKTRIDAAIADIQARLNRPPASVAAAPPPGDGCRWLAQKISSREVR